MRAVLPLVLCACAGCATTSAWEPMPRPWTRDVVDVQRRVRVVLADGTPVEVASPRLEQDAVVWTGPGGEARFPGKRIPLDQVASIETVSPRGPSMGGAKVWQAGLVVAGVVLWALILVAIFG